MVAEAARQTDRPPLNPFPPKEPDLSPLSHLKKPTTDKLSGVLELRPNIISSSRTCGHLPVFRCPSHRGD